LKVAVCPVPGTFGRAVSTWFASIGRRSARCLAPVGRAVPGTCWGEAVQPGLPALDGWYIRCLAPVAAGWSSLFCQHWAAVYPVPGTCCGGVYPVPGTCWPGGFSLFASIGRRSARCLAPVGRAVDSGARNASTVWRQVATAKSQPSAAKRWTAARERIHRLATGGYPRQVATPGQVATARTGGYRPGLQLTHSVRIANLDA
jgi:hypothetical protein